MKICNQCKRKQPDEVEVCDCGSEDLSLLAERPSTPVGSGHAGVIRDPVMHSIVLPACRAICLIGAVLLLLWGAAVLVFGFGPKASGFGARIVIALSFAVEAILLCGFYYFFLALEHYIGDRMVK